MSGVQSIERAFSVLRVLALGQTGVTEVAERTDLPKSTVSRLLSALETEGAVEQVEIGGEYRIGPSLGELAGAVSPDASLGAIVRPFLTELAVQTGGSAGYTVLEGDRVVWIANVDTHDEVVHVGDLSGQSFPLHVVPTGIAVLAAMSDDRIDRYLDRDLEADAAAAFGVADAPDADHVRRRVAAARERGVAASFGDLLPGVNGFAVPLSDARGVVAGLYLQGPSFRFPAAGTEQSVVDVLIAVGRQIDSRLRHR